MTREEQIKEAAYQYAEHFPRAKNTSFVSFKAGVEWCEQNQGSIDWQQVRIQSAIAAMQGMRSNDHSMQSVIDMSEKVHRLPSDILATIAVSQADALVEKLKGEKL